MTSDFFTYNRHSLNAATNGGLTVLAAHTAVQRRGDMAFAFEQESNFWYLTGIDSADWWVICDGAQHKSWLVAPDVSDAHEIFDGSLPASVAQRMSGVDAIVSRSEGEALLREFAAHHENVWTLGDDPHADGYNFAQNPAQKEMRQRLSELFRTVRDCRSELASLRACKQPAEVAAIKQAITVSIDAFETVKKKLPQLGYEYQVQAEFDYYFRRQGAAGHAYDPIVASGKNACTLHYVKNEAKLGQRQLLLLDVGARHSGYAADITRTYSIGVPTKRQRDVHAAVQVALQQIIGLLGPGVAVSDYAIQVDDIMKRQLVSLGLMRGMDDEAGYRRYFPHAISHGLGIDVHDSLGRPEQFEPGMVLTVEPGVYIPEEGIGVRLEDDVLITTHGYENLTKHLSTDIT